jgi:F0F1-type ATP synthase epsilon subunit
VALLTLEIVTPLGVWLERDAVDEIVVRRLEPERESGSEIAVFPRHGPLLVHVPRHVLRYRWRGETKRVQVGSGFVEVFRDRVTVMVPSAEEVGSARPAPVG